MQRARMHVRQLLCLSAILCNKRTGTKTSKQKAAMGRKGEEKKKAEGARA